MVKLPNWSPENVNNPIYFYSGSKDFSSFSNFHKANFDIDGKTFNCVEQYFQWKKMDMFNRNEVADRVYNATNPASMKALARRATGAKLSQSELEQWDKVSLSVMEKAVNAKFKQNPDLMKDLKATGDRALVEKLNFRGDTKWGVNSKNMGRNLLGVTLMKFRAIS